MHCRHFGISRTAVLLLLFILLAIVAAVKFLNEPAAPPPPQAAKPEPKVEDSPTLPRSNVVWLQADHEHYTFCYHGMIATELFRQALLIAARDGLGLQTRDASLREWHTEPKAQNGLDMAFQTKDVSLNDIEAPSYPRWHRTYDDNTWPVDLNAIAETTEKMSREDFVVALKKAGWSGVGNSVKANAAAPADSEDPLMKMEELSQFGVLRETHAAIRTDGESLPRLGVLVRAYANLAQLTRYHWSKEYAVYAARSLLYAQRMVVSNPNSAVALWHRAYARAMAGMQGGALDDLNAAARSHEENPPEWVKLLEPFCKYQTGALVNLATSDPKISTLGMFLAFLSVEQSASQSAIMNVAQAALTLNPHCLRIVDTMCSQTGPGMLNELSETGPNLFSRILGSQLQKLPSFPKPLSDQIDGFRRPEGNPAGREAICQELLEIGVPERDATEPSWAALGRMIQETTFAHVERKANLIAEQWCVDASDYVKEVQPLIAEHPFKFVVDAYGLQHADYVDPQALKHSLNRPRSILLTSTLREMPLYWLETQIQSEGPQTAQDYWGWIEQNSDYNSFDIEAFLNFDQGQENSEWGTDLLRRLRRASPESPILIAADIRGHWDAAKAVKWEADHGDYPAVSKALGQKYAGLKRWSDAERCLRKYISVSPDYEGYEDLATTYKNRQMNDQWLATLKEYLTHGQDYGLQYCKAQVDIADYYMDNHDFKSALPYADAAAQTASGSGLECAAAAHTGLGDWTAAEQLITDEMNHYSQSPFNWYSWCNHTGHGDLAAATKAMQDYFANKGDNLSDDDLMQLGCVQMVQDKNTEALATFQRRLKLFPGPVSALHIAIIYDKLRNSIGRDGAFDQIQTMPERDSALGRFAAVLRMASKAGPNAAPDPAAIDAILQDARDWDRLTICVLAGQYLNDRGQTADAARYYKRCVGISIYNVDRLLVDSNLRSMGLDPWALDQALPSGHSQ